MKKLIPVALILALLCGLTGCSIGKQSGSPVAAATTTTRTQAETIAQPQQNNYNAQNIRSETELMQLVPLPSDKVLLRVIYKERHYRNGDIVPHVEIATATAEAINIWPYSVNGPNRDTVIRGAPEDQVQLRKEHFSTWVVDSEIIAAIEATGATQYGSDGIANYIANSDLALRSMLGIVSFIQPDWAD